MLPDSELEENIVDFGPQTQITARNEVDQQKEITAWSSALNCLPQLEQAAGMTDECIKGCNESLDKLMASANGDVARQARIAAKWNAISEKMIDDTRQYEQAQRKAFDKMNDVDSVKRKVENVTGRIMLKCGTDMTVNKIGIDNANKLKEAEIDSIKRTTDATLKETTDPKVKKEISLSSGDKIGAVTMGAENAGLDANMVTEEKMFRNAYDTMLNETNDYLKERLEMYTGRGYSEKSARMLAEKDCADYMKGVAETLIAKGDYVSVMRILKHIGIGVETKEDKLRAAKINYVYDKDGNRIEGAYDFSKTFYWTLDTMTDLYGKCATQVKRENQKAAAARSMAQGDMKVQAEQIVYRFGRTIDDYRAKGYEITDAVIDSIGEQSKRELDVLMGKGFDKIQEYDQKLRTDINELKVAWAKSSQAVKAEENALAKAQGDYDMKVAQSNFGRWAMKEYGNLPAGLYEEEVVDSGITTKSGNKISVTGRVKKIGFLESVMNSYLCDEETKKWAQRQLKPLRDNEDTEIASRLTRLFGGVTTDASIMDADNQGGKLGFTSAGKITRNAKPIGVSIKSNLAGDGSVRVYVTDDAVIRVPFKGGTVKMSGSDFKKVCDEIGRTMWDRVDEVEPDYVTMRDNIIGNALKLKELEKLKKGDEIELTKPIGDSFGMERKRQLDGQLTYSAYVGNPSNFKPYAADIVRRSDSIRSEIMKSHGAVKPKEPLESIDTDIFNRNLFQ